MPAAPKLPQFSKNAPLFLIAGPCAIESEDMAITVAARLQEITQLLKIPFIFKASYDKANRSSGHSARGVGREKGLAILAKIRRQLGVAVTTDVHLPQEVAAVAKVVDVLQIPAFLCRQTDLVVACAKTGKPINIKKGQFMAPQDMINIVEKVKSVGKSQVLLCERGTCFGYNNLVVDMRSLSWMAKSGCPVVFDATHSTQLPGGLGDKSGGLREMTPVLARAAVAAGVQGLFIETHPTPARAISDSQTQWPLKKLPRLLEELLAIEAVVSKKLKR